MSRYLLRHALVVVLSLWSVAVLADGSDMAEPWRDPPPVQDVAAGEGRMALMQGASLGAHEISILFLYTPDAVRLYGSPLAVSQRINQLVDYANTAYAAAGINLHIVAAAQDLVQYDNSNTTTTAFNHVALKTHVAFADVNRRRMETQADFVVLLRPRKADTAVCGKAYFVGNIASPASNYWTLGGYAYAHVYINCADFVMAHELGHIMGLAHSRDAVGEPNAGKAYAFGAGYKVANDFNTIMASTIGYTNPACCTYLPVFSSPGRTCTGKSGVPKACGVDSAQSNGADAVLAINNIAAQLPKFSDDSDSDGMPDWFEHFWGLDRFSPGDAVQDADGDGLTNLAEFRLETYAKVVSGVPNSTDTDGDGLLDGADPLPTISGNPVFDLNGDFAGSRVLEHVHP